MDYATIMKRAQFEAAVQTEVEELKLSRMRTTLQRTVQILKRHRDIYFNGKRNSDDRPASIIITTLCAKIYEDKRGLFDITNIYSTITMLLRSFNQYLIKNDEEDYYLENPSNKNENFLQKWNDNPDLVIAFYEWFGQAQKDIIERPEEFIEEKPNELRSVLYESFGNDIVEKAFDNYGNKIRELAENGKMYFDKLNAGITLQSTIGTAYKAHTYFGGDS